MLQTRDQLNNPGSKRVGTLRKTKTNKTGGTPDSDPDSCPKLKLQSAHLPYKNEFVIVFFQLH